MDNEILKLAFTSTKINEKNQKIVQMPVHKITVCAKSKNEQYDENYHYIDIWAMTGDKPTDDSRKLRFKDVEQRGMTFAGQPILCSFPQGSNGNVGNEHDYSVSVDKRGQERRSYVQNQKDLRMVGYIQPLEVERPRMEKDKSSGEKWLVLPGKISKHYYPELSDDIQEKGVKGISIEAMTPIENIKELDNGETEHSNWSGIGVAILGDKVAPAFAKAKAVNRMKKSNYSTLSSNASLIEEFEKNLNQEIVAASANNNNKRSETKTLMAKKNTQQILNEYGTKLARYNFVPVALAYNSKQELAAVIGKKGDEIYPYAFSAFTKEIGFIDESDFSALSLSTEITSLTGEAEETIRVNVDTLISDLTSVDGYKKKNEELTNSVNTLTSEIESKNEAIAKLEAEIKEMKDKEMEDAAKSEMENHNEMYEDEDCKKISEQASAEFLSRIKENEFNGNKESMLFALKALKADILDTAQIEINRLASEKKQKQQYQPFSCLSDFEINQHKSTSENGLLSALSSTMNKNLNK